MKTKILAVTALAFGMAFAAAGPAAARVSLNRAETICEAAALAQITPTPARVRAEATGSTRDTVQVSLLVTDSNGQRSTATCSVNRDSGEATVTAAQ
ncbi:MAG: hypothetical protein AB7O04_15095 [Hyphomonadaceae bacterium]